jgi:hypothetical protein
LALLKDDFRDGPTHTRGALRFRGPQARMDARQNFHLRSFTGDAVSTPDPGACSYELESLYDVRNESSCSDEDSRMLVSLAQLEKRVGPTHVDVATLTQDLARIHFEDSNNRKALYLFERAWLVWRQIEGKAGPNLLLCQHELALCLHKDGQHMRAEAMYDSAMSGMGEVTVRYKKAAEREARAQRAAAKHARAMDLGIAGGHGKQQREARLRENATTPKTRNVSRRVDTENVPPRPYLTTTGSARAVPVASQQARKKENPGKPRTSVALAVTAAFVVASAATAAAKQSKAAEDAKQRKPAPWRVGGVAQRDKTNSGVTNPFAYGEGRFVGIHGR